MKLRFIIIMLIFSSGLRAQEEPQLTFDPERSYTQDIVDSILTASGSLDLEEFRLILQSHPALLGWPRYYQGKAFQTARNKQYDSVSFWVRHAEKAYEKAAKKRAKDEKFLVPAYHIAGYAFSQLKEYDSSIRYYQKALDLNKTYPYPYISYSLAGLARIHSEVGNDSISLLLYTELSKDSVYMTNDRSAVSTWNHMANLFRALENPEEAKVLYQLALDRTKSGKFKDDLSMLHSSLGYLHHQQGSRDSAIHYIRRAVEINDSLGVMSYYGAEEQDAFYRAYVDIYTGNLDQGIQRALKLLEVYLNKNTFEKEDRSLFVKNYELLSEAYVLKGDPKQFISLVSDLKAFIERYERFKEQEDLQFWESRFQAKEKDYRIAMLQRVSAQEQRISKQQRSLGLVLGLLLLSAIFFLYYRYRQRIRWARIENEGLTYRLLLAQLNPHFIGNVLGALVGKIGKKSNAHLQHYVQGVSQLFRWTLQSSGEEWVYFDEELEALQGYLEIQCSIYDFQYEMEVEVEHTENVVIPPMMLQPFVENSIVHGIASHKAGRIKIGLTAATDSKLLIFEIWDNGKGLHDGKLPDMNSNSSSMGIIARRLKILAKRLKLETGITVPETDSGTRVRVSIPLIREEL